MKESFEVEIHPTQRTVVRDKEHDTETVDPCERYRYKARWVGRQYIGDNIMCHISAVRPGDDICYGSSWTEYESRAPYEDTFRCRSKTLDGKYRVATVTKHYDDDCLTTNSNLTTYGEKCKKFEPKD